MWRSGPAVLTHGVLSFFYNAAVRGLVADTYGPHAGDVLARYPLGAGTYDPAIAWAAATTDDGWACRILDDARSLSGRPVYLYEFDDPNAPNIGYPAPPDFPRGAYHDSELASRDGRAQVLSPSGDAPADPVARHGCDFWASAR
jgi:para-nitrobenzyl esterase